MSIRTQKDEKMSLNDSIVWQHRSVDYRRTVATHCAEALRLIYTSDPHIYNKTLSNLLQNVYCPFDLGFSLEQEKAFAATPL